MTISERVHRADDMLDRGEITCGEYNEMLKEIDPVERNCFTCGIVDGQMIFRPEKVSEEVLKANDRAVSLAEVCKILQEEYEVCPATWERFRNLSAVEPKVDKDYLIELIQGAVYDGEDCARLMKMVEPKQGEWIFVEVKGDVYFRCSVCREILEHPYEQHDFCPNCGCRMKGADDEGVR